MKPWEPGVGRVLRFNCSSAAAALQPSSPPPAPPASAPRTAPRALETARVPRVGAPRLRRRANAECAPRAACCATHDEAVHVRPGLRRCLAAMLAHWHPRSLGRYSGPRANDKIEMLLHLRARLRPSARALQALAWQEVWEPPRPSSRGLRVWVGGHIERELKQLRWTGPFLGYLQRAPDLE